MLEPNKIYCGDCLEVMKKIQDKSIDLTVTSPPYDNLRDYKGYSFDFEGIAQQIFRVTKDGGVVVWVVADATVNKSKTGSSMRQALYFMGLGFNLHDEMIYQKPAPSYPDTIRYYSVWEHMYIFSKGSPTKVNLLRDRENKSFGRTVTGTQRKKDGKTVKKPCSGNKIPQYGVRFNVWTIYNQVENNNKKHPASFPESLAADHIRSWSDRGDLVLDPFTGSGTTCKMARELHRNFIGIEISSDYVKIAKRRILNAEPQLF